MCTRATVSAIVLLAAALLSACGALGEDNSSAAGGAAGAASNADPDALTAEQAARQLAVSIPQIQVTVTYDKGSDPEHLLGQPHGYLSKVAFSDSRIPKSDTEIFEKGDVEVGGSVEVFADPAAAKARAAGLAKEAKGMIAQSEYDYVQGVTLVRVSHYLSPSQAHGYQVVVKRLS